MPTYNSFKRTLAKTRGINVDADNTYDYRAFYKDNPLYAMKLAEGNRNSHFSDKYKTIHHPTFSDESIYSGKNGLVGGHWVDRPKRLQRWNYRLSPSQVKRNWDIYNTLNYASNAEDDGFIITDSYGRYPIINGIIEGGVLPNINIIGRRRLESRGKKFK